jgi:hypothetical protein
MSEQLQFNDKETTVLGRLLNIEKSPTQSIRVLLLDKGGKKMVSVQKWWRKDSADNWLEGKGFHLNLEDSIQIREALEKAEELM